MIGLETSLPLMLTNLVREGEMSWTRLVEAMAIAPRRVLRLDPVRVQEGDVADLTLIDPERQVTVTPDFIESRSKNTPWMGAELVGCATDAFMAGKRTLTDGVVAEIAPGLEAESGFMLA
jgi:dihydroorotase